MMFPVRWLTVWVRCVTITLDSCIKQNIANFIIIYLSYNMLYCGIGFPVHLLAYPGDILHTVKPRYYQAWSVDASCVRRRGGDRVTNQKKVTVASLNFIAILAQIVSKSSSLWNCNWQCYNLWLQACKHIHASYTCGSRWVYYAPLRCTFINFKLLESVPLTDK